MIVTLGRLSFTVLQSLIVEFCVHIRHADLIICELKLELPVPLSS